MENKKEVPNIIVEEPGHVYQLKNFEKVYNGLGQVGDTKDLDWSYQTLNFIHKEPIKKENIIENTMELISNGTTNEAVIEMMIDRMNWLQNRMPSDYNKTVIHHLELVKMALNDRTSDRVTRGVEGKHLN